MRGENVYVCRKMRILEFLIKRGFSPFASRIDKYDSTRLVWLFDDSPALQMAVAEYYSKE